MLQNAYFLAKIGADTAENEQHFAEILPKIGNYPTGPWWGWGCRPATPSHAAQVPHASEEPDEAVDIGNMSVPVYGAPLRSEVNNFEK